MQAINIIYILELHSPSRSKYCTGDSRARLGYERADVQPKADALRAELEYL